MSWTISASSHALRIAASVACLLALSACGGSSGSTATAAATDNNGSSSGTNTIAIAAPTYNVSQASGAVAVTVARSGNDIGAASVAYSTSNGTAMAGTDYTAVSGTLTWSDGDTTAKTITVPVNSAVTFSGKKSFAIALTDASAGATLGNPASATVMISGGSTSSPTPVTAGSLQFSTATYSVAQTIGTVSVTVNRVNGSGGAIQVTYTTTDGSAVAGTQYTAKTGNLTWADGDTGAKLFSIPINTSPTFSGNKSFAIGLSAATAGATLGSPSIASISIAGAGAGASPPATGGPSKVSALQLVKQGGSNNTATNSQQISWAAATAGANPISYYKIYRNGASYATTTNLTYTDNAATNSNDPTWSKAATIYTYDVTAVDAGGNEGPKSGQMTAWVYQNGKSNWSNNDLSYGSLQENYSSTAGNPKGGAFDISVNFANGGFQPAVQVPQAPQWDLELGAFSYFTIDVNPGSVVKSTDLPFGTVSRLPPGDVYGWHPQVNIYDYGPAPVANTWATYKVPLLAVAMGACDFTGSISGNTLTVTAIVNGDPLVDAGGFVTGGGIPAGTYITAYGQHGAIGTFSIAGPGINSGTHIASTRMTYQRTSLYKFGIQPPVQNITMYFNNMGFTTN
ncbi:MAG TPA: Calx-beta domain-containing protein [Steroidobacteraceae bacterium]|nr:Calx-beta domain-containing protein [Steroidobacteraceae bacterium]